MKRKIIFIAILFFALALISISLLFLNRKRLKVELEDKDVLLLSEAYNTDCIKSIKNGKVKTDKVKLDTSKATLLKEKIIIKDFFDSDSEYTCNYNIVDDEAPVIVYESNLTTTVGSKIDLLNNVTASDNSGEEIVVSVEGEYDFNKENTYNLFYVAEDASGNIKRESFTLVVKSKTNNVQKAVGSEVNAEPIYFETSKGFKGVTKNGITYIDDILIANKTYSLPSNYNPGGLTKETIANANAMIADAKELGLKIWIQSGFRSFETQYALYARYSNRDGALKADTYSARAGHSEHQSGLAFDVNQINSTFDNTEEAKWLHANCYKYGFILRYPQGKTNETGYKYESWHFRYVGVDAATIMAQNDICLEEFWNIYVK